jgi:hypothetical protein
MLFRLGDLLLRLDPRLCQVARLGHFYELIAVRTLHVLHGELRFVN